MRALLKLEVCSTPLKAFPPGVSGLCEDTDWKTVTSTVKTRGRTRLYFCLQLLVLRRSYLSRDSCDQLDRGERCVTRLFPKQSASRTSVLVQLFMPQFLTTFLSAPQYLVDLHLVEYSFPSCGLIWLMDASRPETYRG